MVVWIRGAVIGVQAAVIGIREGGGVQGVDARLDIESDESDERVLDGLDGPAAPAPRRGVCGADENLGGCGTGGGVRGAGGWSWSPASQPAHQAGRHCS